LFFHGILFTTLFKKLLLYITTSEIKQQTLRPLQRVKGGPLIFYG